MGFRRKRRRSRLKSHSTIHKCPQLLAEPQIHFHKWAKLLQLIARVKCSGIPREEGAKTIPTQAEAHLPHHRPPGVGFPPSLNSFGLDDSISQLPSPATLPLIYTQYTIHTQCHPSSKCSAGNLGAGGNNYPAMGSQARVNNEDRSSMCCWHHFHYCHHR